MPKPPLPDHIALDRIQRYDAGELCRTIAQDHGITVGGLLNFIRRRYPGATGMRTRGPRPKDADASA